MPPTHPSQADVAAAYRTLIAHETELKEQDFYRTRLQRVEQAAEPVCEFDCRSRVAAAGVGIYCPQCSAKSADTDLTTHLAIQQIEGEAAWWRSIDFDRNASRTFESMTGDSQQAVRTGVERVLAHLASTGRLIPAGGMALTAKQVEDVKIVLGQLERGGPAFEAAHERLRALFPATEPAEEPCTGNLWCEAPLHTEGCYATHRIPPGRLAPAEPAEDRLDIGTADAENLDGWEGSAPAEPAEEETKAELCAGGGGMHPCVLPAGHSGVHADSRGLRWNNPASSPVIPAPTETGPWPRIEDVPKSVYLIKDCEGDKWRRDRKSWEVYSERGFRWHPGFPDRFAPFVAAKEG